MLDFYALDSTPFRNLIFYITLYTHTFFIFNQPRGRGASAGHETTREIGRAVGGGGLHGRGDGGRARYRGLGGIGQGQRWRGYRHGHSLRSDRALVQRRTLGQMMMPHADLVAGPMELGQKVQPEAHLVAPVVRAHLCVTASLQVQLVYRVVRVPERRRAHADVRRRGPGCRVQRRHRRAVRVAV